MSGLTQVFSFPSQEPLRRADVVEKYVLLDKKTYMSLDETIILARELGQRLTTLKPAPDVVIGLANGAILPTHIAAGDASLPYEMVQVRRKGSRIKQSLRSIKRFFNLPAALLAWHPIGLVSRAFDRHFGKIEEGARQAYDVKGKNVVIVDDCIDTGSSVRYIKSSLASAGANHIHVAVLCWSSSVDSKAMNDVVPDIFLHRRVHYYPWSNNSPFYKDFLDWLGRNKLSLWT